MATPHSCFNGSIFPFVCAKLLQNDGIKNEFVKFLCIPYNNLKNFKNKHSVLKWALYQRKPLILYIEMKKITRKKTETSAVLQSWSVTEEEPLLAFLLHTAKDISRSRMKQYLAHVPERRVNDVLMPALGVPKIIIATPRMDLVAG